MPDEYKLLGVRLNPELHHRFKVRCVQEGLVMAEVMRELIIDWLAERQEGKNPEGEGGDRDREQ